MFGKPTEPPPPDQGALSYFLWIAREWHGIPSAESNSSVDQDLGIYGDDVDDFAAKIVKRYGEWVWSWPWHRFTNSSEGASIFVLFALIWQLVSWPFRGRFSYPSTLDRLELGHIAKVLEKGEWVEP